MEQTSADILDILLQSYKREEFPTLLSQIESWGKSKPLRGISILDASPVFLNTFAKYAALIEAGAHLSIGISKALPASPEALELAKRLAIPTVQESNSTDGFDLVLDCAGEFRKTPSHLGYVELTRSGIHLYESVQAPVWAVDSGRIKQIETSLGTGDGFMRAMKQLGHEDWKGKRLVIFGYGKVGLGIALRARMAEAEITVVDLPEKRTLVPEEINFVSTDAPEAVNSILMNSFCAVTATGIPHALDQLIDAERIAASPLILANMGVEDEWGSDIPESRVLNAKKPLNFILHDPTRMCYIDPALALHNAGAVELLTRSYPPGISTPSPQLEQEYIRTIRERGIIRREMDLIGLV